MGQNCLEAQSCSTELILSNSANNPITVKGFLYICDRIISKLWKKD